MTPTSPSFARQSPRTVRACPRRVALRALAAWAFTTPLLGRAQRAAPATDRIQLTHGMLCIPRAFDLPPEGLTLTLHLHGAIDTVEREFLAADRAGVLVNVTLPGFSKVYADRFRDPAVFQTILSETTAQVQQLTKRESPPPTHTVTVTSFSAGFGGVRELLKQDTAFERIDTLVMLDSIYAGFEGDAAQRKVSATNMEGFLRFAREAAAGRKRFVLSHSQLHTPDYASTVETANYLVTALGGTRETVREDWPGGFRLVSRFRRGQFEVLGFAGETGEDHLRHLRSMAVILRRLSP
jgi:hypothetical protein